MKNEIPFFSLERQTNKLIKKFSERIQNVMQSNQFVGGKFVQEFENNLSKYLCVNHVISCNSGTDALWMALHALGLKKDDIVLTTPFSFIASSSEIVSHDAHPVFIDVDKKTFNIDPEKIKSWLEQNCKIKNGQTIENKTGFPVRGILAVDLFGQCADYEKIGKIAKEWNLWIVQDACQAIGAEVNNKKAGNFGQISCFSFYPTKNLGAFGDAGCCTTNNPNFAEKLLCLRNHGRKSHYEYEYYGINSRMDNIQAVVLHVKLEILHELNEARRQIANIYDQHLNRKKLILPEQIFGKHVYHQYCVQVVDQKGKCWRDELKNHLEKNNIGTNIYFPKSLNKIPFLQTNERLKTECPIAEKLSQTILALPIWPELHEEEVLSIVNTANRFNHPAPLISKFFSKNSPW